MPALPPVANVVRLEPRWSIGSDTDVGTQLFWRYSGGSPSAADCLTLAEAVYNTLIGQWVTYFAANRVMTGLRCTDLSSPSGGDATYEHSTAGTAAGEELSAGACIVVDYLVSRRYRGGKPRSYLPFGTSEDLATPSTWAPTVVNDLTTSTNAAYGAINGATGGSTQLTQQVNVSYYEGFVSVQNPITLRWRNAPKPRNVPVTDNVLSIRVRSLVGSQRRRNQ